MWRRTMCRPSCPRPSPTAWCPWAMPGAAWSSRCARWWTQRRCPEPMALMDSVASPLLPPTDTAPLLPPADKAHLPPPAARAPTPGPRGLDRLNPLASGRRRVQRGGEGRGGVLLGMDVGYANLRAIPWRWQAPEPHFLGSSMAFKVQLSSARRSPRHGIALSVHGAGGAGPQWVWTDVPAQGQARVQLAFKPARRGLQRLPTLTAETRFP